MKPTMTTADIAQLAGVTRRHATGQIVKRPGFPALDKTAESGLRGVADGLADRSHDCRAQRLKCVGNGVVALCAAAAVVVLVQRMKEAA